MELWIDSAERTEQMQREMDVIILYSGILLSG